MYCTYNLKVRNADIEALVHIGMPHDPNIGDKEGSKITLKESILNILSCYAIFSVSLSIYDVRET